MDALPDSPPVAVLNHFAPHTRGRLLGLFLAILELIKTKQLVAEQPEPFGEIWICRAPAADEAAALEHARTGGTFETMCDVLCQWHEPAAVPMQAAGMLERWVLDQMIVAAA